MQFTSIIVTLFATVAFSIPTDTTPPSTPYVACTSQFPTPQCCATDVLGLADLDCINRKLLLTAIARSYN